MSRSTGESPRAWQRMLSGRRLDLLDPSPLDVEIEDIAHGLARVARWNGQTSGNHIFSVAQHTLRDPHASEDAFQAAFLVLAASGVLLAVLAVTAAAMPVLLRLRALRLNERQDLTALLLGIRRGDRTDARTVSTVYHVSRLAGYATLGALVLLALLVNPPVDGLIAHLEPGIRPAAEPLEGAAERDGEPGRDARHRSLALPVVLHLGDLHLRGFGHERVPKAVITAADALILCVPTPLANQREPDLSYIIDAATSLSTVLREGQLPFAKVGSGAVASSTSSALPQARPSGRSIAVTRATVGHWWSVPRSIMTFPSASAS